MKGQPPMKTCAVCSHPRRTEIDRLLVEKVSLRDIAGRFGVSRSALSRHTGHIPGALVAAKEAGKVADAGTLLDQVKGLVVRATGILDRAEQGGEYQAALGAIREVRGCLELFGKLNGELKAGASAIAIASAHPVRTLNDFYAGRPVREMTDAELQAIIDEDRSEGKSNPVDTEGKAGNTSKL